MSVAFTMLMREPDLARLRSLVEYLRPLSEEFIFVVDDRTRIETVNTLRTWPGVEIRPFHWIDDFAAARNTGLAYINSDWTCYFDPDEMPTAFLWDFIRRISRGEGDAKAKGYLFNTYNYYGGQNLYQLVESDWHLRMWRTGHGKFYRPVHELVEIDGEPESSTRGKTVVKCLDEGAHIIHAKPAERITDDDAYYARIDH